MKFVFLGDVHGNMQHCLHVAQTNTRAVIVQVGDMGVGFRELKDISVLDLLPPNFKFFVGNHDNRQLANTSSVCLGDFGEYLEKIFFVSGANSIDKEDRIEGISWWADEELSYKQGVDCLDLWEKSQTKILVSHDCPQSIAEGYKDIYDKSSTRSLLQQMIEVRKPEMIVCGHHHYSHRLIHDGIQYIGLDINEAFLLDIL